MYVHGETFIFRDHKYSFMSGPVMNTMGKNWEIGNQLNGQRILSGGIAFFYSTRYLLKGKNLNNMMSIEICEWDEREQWRVWPSLRIKDLRIFNRIIFRLTENNSMKSKSFCFSFNITKHIEWCNFSKSKQINVHNVFEYKFNIDLWIPSISVSSQIIIRVQSPIYVSY